MKIIYLKLTHLKRGQHYRFGQYVLVVADKHQAVKQRYAIALEALRRAHEYEDEVLLKHRRNFLTPEVEDAQTQRRMYYTLFRTSVKKLCDLQNEEKRREAEFLWTIVKDYSYITNKQYEEQSGLLENLCFDLKHKHTEQVERLGLTNLVEDMDRANAEFIRIYNERTESKAGFIKNELTVARRATDKAYSNLRNQINSNIDVEGAGDTLPFVESLNAEIEQLRTAIGQGADTPEADLEEDEEDDGILDGDEDEDQDHVGEDEDENTGAGGESTGKPKLYWVDEEGRLLHTQEYEPGEKIVPPTPPAGYIWNYHPNYMPDHDLTVNCILDE